MLNVLYQLRKALQKCLGRALYTVYSKCVCCNNECNSVPKCLQSHDLLVLVDDIYQPGLCTQLHHMCNGMFSPHQHTY